MRRPETGLKAVADRLQWIAFNCEWITVCLLASAQPPSAATTLTTGQNALAETLLRRIYAVAAGADEQGALAAEVSTFDTTSSTPCLGAWSRRQPKLPPPRLPCCRLCADLRQFDGCAGFGGQSCRFGHGKGRDAVGKGDGQG